MFVLYYYLSIFFTNIFNKHKRTNQMLETKYVLVIHRKVPNSIFYNSTSMIYVGIFHNKVENELSGNIN